MLRVYHWARDRYSGPQYTLEQKIRNAFIVFMTIVWLLMSGDFGLSIGLQGFSKDRMLRKAGSLMIAALLPFGLVRSHYEENVSDATVSYLLQVCAITNTFNTLLVPPTRPMDQYAIFLMMLTLSVNLKHWGLHFLAMIPALIIMSYNRSFGISGYTMWSIVTPEDSNVILEVLVHSRLFVTLPLAVYMIRMHILGYRDAIKSLECSVEMTKEVSEHLAEYNTTKAEKTLTQYRERNDCDKDLCNGLLLIVENLKKYKPYLPNFVVSSDDQDLSDSQLDGSVNDSAPSTLPPRNSMDSQSSSQDGKELLQSVVPIPPTTSTTPVQNITSLKLLATIPELRDISYALIDFRHKNEGIIDNPIPLRVFIDKVYRTANVTQAAIHTCVGDTIHATWNGASKVNNPKSGAVTFVRILSGASFKNPGTAASSLLHTVQPISNRVDVCSSVMSGTAECRMTGTVHHTFLLHRKWGEAHNEHFRYALRMNTNVVCGETAKGIRDILMLTDVLDVEHLPYREVYELSTPEQVKRYGSLMTTSVKAYGEGHIEEAFHEIENAFVSWDDDAVPLSVCSFRKKLQNKLNT